MKQHCMAWQWLTASDTKYLQKAPHVSGYGIYAPVMYGVEGPSLKVIKDFSRNIALARQKGYGIWLTFQQFGNKPNLEDPLINEIINTSLCHGADGINIDFEGMGRENRERFTAFIDKLYQQTRKHSLILSVDVVRPAVSMYSLCYDRRALAQKCDFLVLMAYDQHWATSPQEGSVADLPWTENSVKMLLHDEDVPAEKLILAIPFYSRNWKIKIVQHKNKVLLGGAVNLRSGPSTDFPVVHAGSGNEAFAYLGKVSGERIAGESTWYKVEYQGKPAYVTAAYATYLTDGESRRVSSSAIGLQSCIDILVNFDKQRRTSYFSNQQMTNVDIMYEKSTQQTLVTYHDGEGHLNKIWLEDYSSLAKRRQLMEKYNLAGLAAWSLEWIDRKQQAWKELQSK